MSEIEKKLLHIRQKLFDAIKKSLEEDGHCKSYEGTFSLTWPSYFGGEYVVSLDCYVIGPSRHYSWGGEDFMKALLKAEADIDYWIKDRE